MFTIRRLLILAFLSLIAVATAIAQTDRTNSSPGSGPVVTMTTSRDGVRFTAPSNVARLQLEVLSELGQILFEVSSRGNVLDWTLQDHGGQRLSNGSYLCVVTMKSLSGRLTHKTGVILIQDQSVTLKQADQAQLTSGQQQAIGPIEDNSALTILDEHEPPAVTTIANNGTEGQMIRSRGALSFRVGDFFSGNDQEQMRLTEDGNLGIGTAQPQAKLDVAGTIRAERVLIVKPKPGNNTAQATDTTDSAQPLASGSGTQNRIAKWIDNAGTLGDSIVLDTGTGLQLTAAPSISVDTNLLYLNSTNGTTGVLAGSTPSYGANNGPFFAMRGNSYTTIGNQRGLFTIAAGNVANPQGDDGSVKFNTGNDQLRMVIRPNGNVGIGTNEPANKLHIHGGGLTFSDPGGFANQNRFAWSNSPAFAPTGSLTLDARDDANGFVRSLLAVQHTGNVGIGTTAPLGRLDVRGDILLGLSANPGFLGSNSLFVANDAGTPGNSFRIDGANDNLYLIAHSDGSAGAGIIFRTATAGAGETDQAKIDENGNVGIGTTAPTARLTVFADSASPFENTATFGAPNIGGNQSHIHYGTTGDWYIRSAANTGKVILQDSGGNVGIGTTNPLFKLHVKTGTDRNLVVRSRPDPFNPFNPLPGIAFKSINDANSVSQPLELDGSPVILNSPLGESGNVGIGTLNPEQKLDVNGPIKWRQSLLNTDGGGSIELRGDGGAPGTDTPYIDFHFSTGSSQDFNVRLINDFDGRLSVVGTLRVGTLGAGGTALCRNLNNVISDCVSSIRYKDHVLTLRSGLDVVRKLRPVSFRWKDGGQKDVGLVAEEVNQVEPLLVTRNARGEVEGVKYDRLGVVLINAIKEQQAQIEQQQAEAKQQQDQIAALRLANAALNARLRAVERTSRKKSGSAKRPR